MLERMLERMLEKIARRSLRLETVVSSTGESIVQKREDEVVPINSSLIIILQVDGKSDDARRAIY